MAAVGIGGERAGMMKEAMDLDHSAVVAITMNARDLVDMRTMTMTAGPARKAVLTKTVSLRFVVIDKAR